MIVGTVAYACPIDPRDRRKKTRASWIISARPDVRIRIRRTFGKASKVSGDTIILADSAETARDILWFLGRYPMDAQCRDFLEAGAHESESREKAIDGILSDAYTPPPIALAVPLRPYQVVGARMALQSRGLLLGDDVGLGKTSTAIGTLNADTLPACVVTLSHLPRQWKAEIERFAPDLRVCVPRNGKPEEIPTDGSWDVVVTNYHKLRTLGDVLAPIVKSVIFDECQELRREDSEKYRAARHMADHATMRMGLSATPIYNYGGEIYSVIDCLSPDALGTREEFTREWCTGYGQTATLSDPRSFGLYARSAGLMLRRTRSEVGRELPPLTRIVHQVDSDSAPFEGIEARATELARIILADTETMRGQKMQASEELSYKLRMATGIAKARAVSDFAAMLAETGEKVVLFGWHKLVYDLWKSRLAVYGPAFYTGGESEHEKNQSLRRFIDKDCKILCMSLRAGAGIDGLQGVCRTVLFGELDWSPGVHEQAIGRVFRDGQADPVIAYFLVSDGGSDPVVSDVLGIKHRQSDGLRNPDASSIERLEIDPDHVKKLAASYLARRHFPIEA